MSAPADAGPRRQGVRRAATAAVRCQSARAAARRPRGHDRDMAAGDPAGRDGASRLVSGGAGYWLGAATAAENAVAAGPDPAPAAYDRSASSSTAVSGVKSRLTRNSGRGSGTGSSALWTLL